MIKLINSKGFTLIETVISLGVLSIGILALFAMQTLGIRANASASRVTSLATSGGDDIEQILPITYDQVNSTNSDLPDCDPNAPGIKYPQKRTVLENIPVENIKTIDVTVTRCVDGASDGKQAKFRYLKANENPM